MFYEIKKKKRKKIINTSIKLNLLVKIFQIWSLNEKILI